MRHPLTIAHRGASAVAPENTLAALTRAVALGADMVEVDVQRTRDGALVLLHDATPARTTDARQRFPGRAHDPVGSFALAELRRLDAGGWHDGRYAGERVPTLAQALDLVRVAGVGMLLELKLPAAHPGVVADLAAELRWYGADHWPGLVVQSFDVAAAREVKERLPAVRVGVLGRPPVGDLPVLAEWADQVNPPHRSASRGYVEAVRAAGMECLVWTVDRPAALRRAVRRGVDGVITNRPERMPASSRRPAVARAAA